MQLPETTNANYIYAFKKGYRYAQEGKPLSYMPSQIRHDGKMREYFQQGWDQFQEELANGEKAEHESPWRSRVAWFLMAVVAGLGTASLMVSEMQSESTNNVQGTASTSNSTKQTPAKSETQNTTRTLQPSTPTQQANSSHGSTSLTTKNSPIQKNADTSKETQPVLSLLTPIPLDKHTDTATPPSKQTETTTLPADKKSKATPKTALHSAQSPAIAVASQPSLRLLSPSAHQDLVAQKQAHQPKPLAPERPLIQSTIQVSQAQFCEKISNKQCLNPLPKVVPKYIRKTYFFTRIQNAKGKTITHRWIYQNQIMADVPLTIKSQNYRTWSSKQLSSAWPGKWRVEVLDDQKHPIARYTFYYIKEALHEKGL